MRSLSVPAVSTVRLPPPVVIIPTRAKFGDESYPQKCISDVSSENLPLMSTA